MNFDTLLRRNWYAAGAHFVLAVLLIIFYNVWSNSKGYAYANTFRYQLAAPNTPAQCNTANGVPPDPDQCNVQIVYQKPKALASFNIIYGTIAFFLITVAAHVFYGTDAFGSGAYTRNIGQGWNPYRWFEYGLSASLMTLLIGLIDGTQDLATLIMLVLATAAMQFCGFAVEATLRGNNVVGRNGRDSILGSSIVGWLLFVGIWFVLIFQFANLVFDVNTLYANETLPNGNKVTVPAWVWLVVFLQLAWYASFGIVQAIHIRRRLGPVNSKSTDYSSIESYYILLSFLAKINLAVPIGYGLLWRTKDCPAV